MRIKNTSRYPTVEIEQLVRFAAKGVGTSGAEVHVKNSRHVLSGGAWRLLERRDIVNEAKCVDYLVVIRVGLSAKFPIEYCYPRIKRAPRYTIENWREAIVTVTAHELYHIKQRRTGKRTSEVKAERWALNRLEDYRKSPLYTNSALTN
jgi:hypothetical protein